MSPLLPWALPAATLVVSAVLTLAFGACAARTDASTPPTLRLGEDVCTRSGMIISEPAYAAAYRTADGDERLFDDIGEMVLYNREHNEQVVAFWVHDLATHEWLRADSAHYVVSPSIHTPMDFGVAALGTEADARQQAAQVMGRVLTFEELLGHQDLREGSGRPASHG